MSESSRHTTPPATPPEFFVDRSLGTTVTAGLQALGWKVKAINDVFPNDAQEVSDAKWLTYGFARGWAALTKDKKIRRGSDYREATGPIFALSDGNLNLAAMVMRFDAHRARIWAASLAKRREFWMVYESSIQRQDPRAR